MQKLYTNLPHPMQTLTAVFNHNILEILVESAYITSVVFRIKNSVYNI